MMWKHLSKRIPNTLISMKKRIGMRVFTHADLESGYFGGRVHKRHLSLLNQMDKQNVPYATDFLLRMYNFSEKDKQFYHSGCHKLHQG